MLLNMQQEQSCEIQMINASLIVQLAPNPASLQNILPNAGSFPVPRL